VMVEEVDDSHVSNVHLQLHWLLSRWGVANFSTEHLTNHK